MGAVAGCSGSCRSRPPRETLERRERERSLPPSAGHDLAVEQCPDEARELASTRGHRHVAMLTRRQPQIAHPLLGRVEALEGAELTAMRNATTGVPAIIARLTCAPGEDPVATGCLPDVWTGVGTFDELDTFRNRLSLQPDASATITRTLFVGLAMIESTAIYCFVVSMILLFANPFWNHVIAQAPGK